MAEPVQKSIRVDLPVEAAFHLFTTGMDRWWPLDEHSIAVDTHQGRVRAEGIVFEERAGGRIYETMSDGSEGDWGKVLTWEPPHLVGFTWKPNLTEGPSTEIEVRFATSDPGTEVELQHVGWERSAGDDPAHRARYETGWDGVLDRYRSEAER